MGSGTPNAFSVLKGLLSFLRLKILLEVLTVSLFQRNFFLINQRTCDLGITVSWGKWC